MKNIARLLILGLLTTLFASTISFDSDLPTVKVGQIVDNVQISLDSKLQASLENLATTYELDKVFVSSEFPSEFDFNFVSLEWYEDRPEETSVEMFMRTRTDDIWTDWTSLETDTDDRGDASTSFSFIATNPSDAFQYKVKMHTDDSSKTPFLKDINFEYLDTTAGVTAAPTLSKVTFNGDDVDIISRSSWGADKDYRLWKELPDDFEDDWGMSSEIESELWDGEFDDELDIDTAIKVDPDGQRLKWVLEYPEDTDKIVIHHTATDEDLDDPEAALRAIYYYHSISRGWGDIGYNYVIDQYGNIYEGRYGGEGVVGGHTAGYNVGTIGIAVLGNYEYDELTYEALVSLLALIKDQADEFDIDVDGTSRMREKMTKNLVGHKDLDETACPGDGIYDLLPYIRSTVSSSIDIFDYDENDEFAYTTTSDWEPLYLDPEDEGQITFKLKNIGTATWNSDTFLIANKDTEGDKIVSLNKTSDSSIAKMNESSVAPGSTATFTVKVNSTLAGGFVDFQVTPLFNGYKKTSNYMSLPIYIEAPNLDYEVVDVDLGDRLKSGKTMEAEVELENTGNVTWSNTGDSPIYLEPAGSSDLWTRTLMNESTVEPGDVATFNVTLTGPEQAGIYTEYFVPAFGDVARGDRMSDGVFEVLVYNASKQAEFVDSSDKIEFAPGEEAEVWIEMLNTGYQDWTPSTFSAGFLKYMMIGASDGYLVETRVEPGETGKFKFTVEAPEEIGDFKINVKPRVNGRNLIAKYFYYEFSVVEDDGVDYSQPDVRVALSFEGNPVITADGTFRMYSNDKLIRNFSEDDQVEVSFDGENYSARTGGFAWVLDSFPTFSPANNTVIMEVANYENRPAWNTDLNDNRYRGSLEIREVDGELTVINELPLEWYVKGIAEVSNGDPTEKLRTMAVIARTYALYYVDEDEKFPGLPYDLNDDPDVCQKYLGYGYEQRSPNMADAVEATEGKVVTYNGDLVKTPYFNATDGTYTKSAESVWGWTHTPYLVPVEDPLCDSSAFSGHGVGLSGCGAEAAAENGSTYDEIIEYYYTGVEIMSIEGL